MIKRKVKAVKRKNPFTNTNDVKDYISKNSYLFTWIGSGAQAKVYKFDLAKKIVLQTKILIPGTYALKLLTHSRNYYDKYQIDYLTILSNYGLIPKIFVITKNYIISKFIEGHTYSEVKEMYKSKEIDRESYLKIADKIDSLLDVWYKLKFRHDDIHDDNIIVSMNLNKVYLIDPSPYDHYNL